MNAYASKRTQAVHGAAIILGVVALLASGCGDGFDAVNPVPTPGSGTAASRGGEGGGSSGGRFNGMDAGASDANSSDNGQSSSGGTSSSGGGSDAGGSSSSGAGDTWSSPPDATGGNTGLAQAGAQDFGLFRQILEKGQVPKPGTLDDLGFFNEHKLDYPQPKCGAEMCMHGLLGQMGNMITGSTCTVVQIGLNTPIQPSKLKRPPLHIVLAVDTSSSMSGQPLGYLKQGLKQMLDHLENGDKVSLVRFASDAKVVVEAKPMSDKLAIEKAIIALAATGKTNLYAGLFTAFKVANKHHDKSWDNRVVLLTDGQASEGLQHPGKLVSLAAGYAKKGIGITTIGVGKDVHNGVLADIAEVGAGNFYFLDKAAAVKEVFTEEVKTFLVPVALDVTIKIDAEDAYVVGAAYGTKGWKGHNAGGTIHIPTLFLAGRQKSETPLPATGSGRRGGGGAIMIELMPLPGVKKGVKVANLDLSWTHPKTGKKHSQQSWVLFGTPAQADGSSYFSSDTVEKGFVMLNILAAFRMAANLAADSDPGAAQGVLLALRPAVKKWLDSKKKADPDIEDDLKYVDMFIANLKKLKNQTPISKPPEPWPID